MNTRSPRNDDDALAAVRGSLTAVRDSLEGVHMERPVEALVARGRARRARRSLAIRAAVACGDRRRDRRGRDRRDRREPAGRRP